MALTHTDGDFTTPQVAGPRRWFVPFRDNKRWYFEQDYMVNWADFETSPLSTLYVPTTSGSGQDLTLAYYLVRESSPSELGGGLCQFTRTFAAVPSPREEHESYAYTFPGLETGSLGPLKYISGTPTSASSVTTITTTTSHGISVGDQVIIRFTVQLAGGQQFGAQILRTALTGTTGTTLKVDIIVSQNPVVQWISAQSADIGRSAYTEEVSSTLIYEYFLIGISPKIKTADDIEIYNTPIIVDSDGTRTDTYTSTTAPTKAEYLVDVKTGANIVATDSVIRPWMGNIYERVTRYVRAK